MIAADGFDENKDGNYKYFIHNNYTRKSTDAIFTEYTIQNEKNNNNNYNNSK